MSIDLSKNTDMTVINTMTFSGCSFLGEVKLPSGITVIESNAFNSCISLDNTDFIKDLDKLTEIGSYSFAQSGISTATIPGNVETVGLYAFTDCDNLTKVTFEDFAYEPTEPVENLLEIMRLVCVVILRKLYCRKNIRTMLILQLRLKLCIYSVLLLGKD